ncbi:MAG TPA: TonB-dependent receptor [Burkholderiales bacterium]|nr:TonB-dependent receptor [Burkholderiales bacterium]
MCLSVCAEDVFTDAIVVTATRTAQTADETLASVTVITRQDIERRQPQDIVELLRTETGIDISRAGGIGGSTNLFMRGTNSNQTLVLIDGVRAASATTGTFEFRSMSLSQIERIEIVRGPRASLYGSDAIGGVIQIFTRQPQGPTIAVGGGSFGSRFGEVGTGDGESTRFGVNASYYGDEGFSATNQSAFSFNPDNDGFRRRSVNASFATPLWSDAVLELRGWHTESDIEFDNGDSDSVNQTLATKLTHKLSNVWTQSLNLGYIVDELDTRSSTTSRIVTHRRMADWQHDLSVTENQLLTLGLSYQQDAAFNRNPATSATVFKREIDAQAIYGLWQGRWKPVDAELSVRHDEHSNYGGCNTGSVAVGGDVSPATRLWLSYGTGFRAPTINQLYHPGTSSGRFAGNPNLEPERSRSAEIGIVIKPSPEERIRTNLYQTELDNLIAFEGVNSQAINISKASVRGLEVEYGLTKHSWSYRVGATFQRARNDLTDAELERRPESKLSILIQRQFGQDLTAGADMLFSSDAADTGGRLDGYGIINLAIQMPLSRDIRLQGRIENLLDKEYQLVNGFNTPDRSVFITLRYEPRNKP